MSGEEITDVQPAELKENGEQEAPPAVQQEQQQEAKEVEGMSTSMCEDQQESMDTSSIQQEGSVSTPTEGGATTPMEDSTSQENDQMADSSAVATGESGSGDIAPESGEEVVYDNMKIFVGGLSWETTNDTLKKYFEKYGDVSEVKVKVDAETGRSRGFAFVIFKSPDAVEEVMKNLPHNIDGRNVDAKRAIPHAVHQAMKNRTKKIFVGGVPVDMPEKIIHDYFIQYGEIEEVALVTDKATKKRRGFCFVTYISEDSVDKCTEQTFHTLNDTQVEVKRATPREQSAGSQGGRGRGGRGQGGYGGRAQYAPYGQPYHGGYGGYHGGYSPYGGYSYPPPPPYGPYGGGGPYGPPGYDQGVYGSRYGPMKQNHSGGSYHPYSR